MNKKPKRLPFESVTIDGFRGLKNLRLEDLGPVNILVGDNNSGKTSVLEALSIACNPYEPYEWLAMVRRRDFGGLDETRIQSLRWCFPQQGELFDPEFSFNSKCVISTDGGFLLRDLIVEYKDILGMPSEKELARLNRYRRGRELEFDDDDAWQGAELVHHVGSLETVSLKNLVPSELYPNMDSVGIQVWENDPMIGRPYRPRRSGSLPTETLTPYSYQLNKLQVRSQSNQVFSNRADPMRGKEHVLDLVRTFDPDIEDMQIASFRGGRPAIYLNHKRLGPAPLSIFGDALRRAVLLSSTLPMLKGGLLLIDEIETGIHIGSLTRVFDWLMKTARDLDVQVVATTHSLEALDGIVDVLGDDLGDLVTYHIDNDGEESEVKRIYGDLLRRLRHERGLDVR